MTQNLSPKLLHDLEQYYDQIALMWKEGVPFEEVINRLKISYEQLYDMHLIMFNELPTFTATDIFGYTKKYMYNTYTNRTQEVKDDEAL